MKNLISALLLSCLTLSGCSTLNEKFDCPAPQGGSCHRMDQVYDMVNGKDGRSQKRLTVAPAQNPLAGKEVMHIWVAPHEDTDGNYHQANQIQTVISEEGEQAHAVYH